MRLRSRLRLPKEHGAWAMLYVPLVVGMLVAGTLNWRVLMLSLSVTFLFISRESVVAWWRGRSRRQAQGAAWQTMLIYLGLAALFGVPLVIVHQLFLLVPLGLATLILLIINAEQAARREDRTTSGEILAIIGLTLTAPTAYYVSRGAWEVTALWLWALCALYFMSSVFYVKLRVYSLSHRKEQLRKQAWQRCAFYHTFLAVSLAAIALTGSLSLFALAAFFPVLARSLWQLARPALGINLRRIGVLEILYSLVFLIFITLTFRTA